MQKARHIMANPWFRMYSEFASDPKVQMLSEVNQRRLTMLFCLRCNDLVTLQDTEVTFLLRISYEDWMLTKSIFIERGFIDENNELLNWDKRQFSSDTSKNRVAAYRERKKQTCNVDVTLQKRQSNAIEQNRTEQNIKNTSLAMLVNMGVSENLAKDWIKVRKEKRLAITQTALDKIKSESDKIKLTFSQAIQVACENGWGGFKAAWMDNVETIKPDFMKDML